MTNMTTCGFVLWAVPRFRRDVTLDQQAMHLTGRADYVDTFSSAPAVIDRTRQPSGLRLPTKAEHREHAGSKA